MDNVKGYMCVCLYIISYVTKRNKTRYSITLAALKIVRVYDDLTIGSTYLENSIEAWCK